MKPSRPDNPNSNLNFRQGSFNTENITLATLLGYVYDFPSDAETFIENAPHWVRTDGYDLDAKEDEVTAVKLERMSFRQKEDALRPMVGQLIQERFALKTHTETKQLQVLALVISKNGSKLRPAKAWEHLREDPSNPASPPAWSGLHNPGAGRSEGRAASLPMLLRVLGGQPEVGGRIVVDRTGLTGAYDFTLHWTPENQPNRPDNADTSGPPLFTALQDQLGLKLQPETLPIQILVIDHVERPSPN